jgi:RNA polymerase sigma factor (sigma-70 family)
MDIKNMTKEEIYIQNKNLIHTALKSFKQNIKKIQEQSSMDYDDLFQECSYYFLKLIDRFDPEKSQFSTFIISSLRLYINGVILKNSTIFHVPKEVKRAYYKISKHDMFELSDQEIAQKLDLTLHSVKQSRNFHAIHLSLDAPVQKDSNEGFGSHIDFLYSDDFAKKVEAKIMFENLAEAMFTPEEKKAVLLYFYLGYSQKEISSLMKVSKTTVDNYLSNAKRKATIYNMPSLFSYNQEDNHE